MRPFGFAKKDFIRIQEGIARDIYKKSLAGKLHWGDTKRLIEERKKTYPWLKESTIQYYLTKLRKQPKPLPTFVSGIDTSTPVQILIDDSDTNNDDDTSLPELIARDDDSLSDNESNCTLCETEEKELENCYFQDKCDAKLPSNL